ncbi:MFS transporter [Actinospica sp.]|uniref:MFS transporter n=1 Tax=Actinospica sp. TaxID=1872142 RepID=UPI002BA68A87|nr:MFS transporter [Actinospica sp.]HWG22829.1 MFS transporter [Actinospica sp.]
MSDARAVEHQEHTGHPRRWIILTGLVFSLLVVVLDNTVLNVALKTMSEPKPKGLGASQSDLEWAINSYTLIFAGLLFTWGLLADRLGRKRILMLGMVLFGLSSLLTAYAQSPTELIAARAAMGFSGAAIMPSTLAIIANVFPRHEQPKAIGIWSGSVGLAIAIGPIVGGALLNSFWWGSVFLINVPITVIAFIVMLILLPESKNPNPGRLDPIGVLLEMAGLVIFVYGIIHAGDTGDWGAVSVWGSIGGGLLLLVGFVLWELHTSHPALDVRLFANRMFSAAVISVALTFFAMMGGMFFFSFYLQSVRGYTPLKSGVFMLPFAAAMVIFSPLSSNMVKRFGPRAVAVSGLLAIAIAMACYQFVTQSSAMWIYLLIAFFQGAAMANVMPPATTTVMAALPRQIAGVGSSVNNTVRQLGGALGVAVLGTILTTAYRSRMQPLVNAIPNSHLTAAQSHYVSGSIEATQQAVGVAVSQGNTRAAGLLQPANESFVHAMHVTTLTGAVIMVFAAIVVALWLPKKVTQAAGPVDAAAQAESVAA